jgi:type I restriction enzyme, S subunit
MKENIDYKCVSDICIKGSSNIAQNKLIGNSGDYPIFGASGFIKNIDFYHQESEYIGIVKDGSGVGRVNKYPSQSSLLGTMQYILPKDGNLLDYIKYALQSLDLSHFATGVAIPHIYFRDYGKCKIPVPPLPEQQAIASELDAIQSLITKYKEQLNDYDNLAKSIFNEMFGDVVSNDKGWERKKLGDVCEVARGGSPRPIQNYLTVSSDGINWIKIGDTDRDGKFILNTKEKIKKEGLAKSRYVKVGDFLLSNSMSFGRPYILKINGCIHDGWLVLSNFSQYLLSDYFYYLLRTNEVQVQFNAMANGVAVKNLNSQIVKQTDIILPPLPLQQKFADRITAIESQKDKVKQQIVDLQTLFDSRMQYYFD